MSKLVSQIAEADVNRYAALHQISATLNAINNIYGAASVFNMVSIKLIDMRNRMADPNLTFDDFVPMVDELIALVHQANDDCGKLIEAELAAMAQPKHSIH